MIYREENYNLKIDMPKPLRFYLDGARIGVLDIETTGLSPDRNKFILGGLMTVDDERQKVEQFFAENRDEEKETLKAYLRAIEGLDLVVTYNGKHFDIPFILKRADVCGINVGHGFPQNLDLYLALNAHSELRKILPNLKQKTVENFFGLWETRTDEISGAESVELYNRYCRTKEPDILEKVLLHNSDDVLQLYKLMPIMNKVDIHKAMTKLGYTAPFNMAVEEIHIKGNELHVNGRQKGNSLNYYEYPSSDSIYSANFDAASHSFHLIFYVKRHEGMALIDLEDLAMDFSELSMLPGCESGYLILQRQNQVNYMEINHFVKIFLKEFLRGIV